MTAFGIKDNENSNLNLYDEDILKLEKVFDWVKQRQHQRMDLEDFRRNAIERFYDAGFKVNVKVYETTENDGQSALEGVYAFDFEILDRVNREEQFDFDRQVHQVVNNLLELPDQNGGWINTDEALMRAEREQRERGRHKH